MTALEDLKKQLQNSGQITAALALETVFDTQAVLRYRRHVPIRDCGEPLEELPEDLFLRLQPHPYAKVGAPYGGVSPYFLRKQVLRRLSEAQKFLAQIKPGYRLLIYDAFRPLAVQRYMVEFEFRRLVCEAGLVLETISADDRERLMAKVYSIWAKPNADPAVPPPHSTGAAVDLTLADAQGKPLDMGSEIDAIGEQSLPNYFAGSKDEAAQTRHNNRSLLNDVMSRAGFCRLPFEWWHFSCGDQMWALLCWLDGLADNPEAIYGRVDID